MQNVAVTGIEVSEDGRKISLSLANLKPGYIYELKLGTIKSADGKRLENELICYTLNNLVNGNFQQSSME